MLSRSVGNGRALVVTGLVLAAVLATLLPSARARAATGQALYASPHRDRSSATPLAGRVVTGDIHVFFARSSRATDTSGLTKVSFSLDGGAARVESLKPFDLMGESGAYALPLRFSSLTTGTHVLRATVTYSSGVLGTFSSTFTASRPTATTTTVAPTTTTTVPPTTTTVPPTTTTTTTTTTTIPALPIVESRVPRFAPTSFWYQAIPNDVALHPSSSALVADFDRQWKQYYGNVSINTSSYAPPFHLATSTTPLRTVRFWDCQGKGYVPSGFVDQMRAVPIPAGVVPSAGTDAEMVVYAPHLDTVWELWRARVAADGTWEACWGGRIQGVSTSDGVFANPYGTTATGLSLAPGAITPEELAAGRIDHAIAVSLPEARIASVFSWPANRSDGRSDRWDAIPEGLRLRLDPTIDVNALPISRAAKTIARAMQTYGLIVRDLAGAVTLYGENVVAEGRPNPYPALFDGLQNYQVLGGIPWHRLQALPMHYGRP